MTPETTPVSRTRERLARAAAAAAFLASAWALGVALGGGIRLQVAGVLISSREPIRPAAAAAAALVAAFVLAAPSRRSAPWQWLRRAVERVSPIAVAAAVAGVVWLALAYGARTASGADTFGYVSHAYLWVKGSLEVPQPLAAEVPWPHANLSLSPLGYLPGQTPATMVPTYSPGLPLIMAGLLLIFGHCGPYYVQPLAAALLVAATFGLAWRLTRDRLTSTLAAVFTAASPAVLFNLMTPMSDTMTAALWTVSLLLLTWPGARPAAAAGIAAGIALLVRPNLAPLALAGMLAAALWPPPATRSRLRLVRALLFAACVAPAAILVGVLNDTLYGSPLQSGYGPTSALYGLSLFPGNVRRYVGWLVESHSPFVLLAIVPVLVARVRPAWLTRDTALPLAAVVIVICLSYFFYVQFRDWWYLRFLLPAFPVLFLLLASLLSGVVRAAPALAGLAILVAALGFGLHSWLGFLVHVGAMRIGEGEERYAAVARYIDRELPPGAVIFSMQHSGTIRFYSERATVRYEFIAPARFRPALEWLAASGRPPYILLENWEQTDWRRHFAEDAALASLDFRVLAELKWPAGIRLYDPLAPPDDLIPPHQIALARDGTCQAPRGAWTSAAVSTR